MVEIWGGKRCLVGKCYCFKNMGRMGRVGFLLPSRVPKGLAFLVCGVTFQELGMRLMFEDPSMIRGLVSRQGWESSQFLFQ